MYWWWGLRFDQQFVGSAMQVADYDLLVQSPFWTVWYLHLQPPLFNLFVGVGGWMFGPWAGAGFQIVYLAVSAVMLTAFVRFCLDLGVRRPVATALGVALAISPTIAQYESMLFYPHLELALIVLAARALQQWCLTGGRRHLVGFSVAMSALALGRSLYHPLWFVGLGLWLVLIWPPAARRRALVVAITVPMLCGVAVGAKNAAVFGWWTTGSLEGINLHRITEPFLTDHERSALVADGTITSVSTEDFSCIDAGDRFGASGPNRPVSVLDRERRAADGRLQNLNQRHNVQCLKELRAESLRVIVRAPDAYLRGVGRATPIAFSSAVPDVRTRPGNQEALTGAGRVESLVLGSARAPLGPFDRSFGSFQFAHIEWLLMAMAVAVPAGLVWALARRRCLAPRADPVVLAFMAYVALTGVVLTQLTEVGENNRLMVMSWPMLMAGAGLLVARVRGDVGKPDGSARGTADES